MCISIWSLNYVSRALSILWQLSRSPWIPDTTSDRSRPMLKRKEDKVDYKDVFFLFPSAAYFSFMAKALKTFFLLLFFIFSFLKRRPLKVLEPIFSLTQKVDQRPFVSAQFMPRPTSVQFFAWNTSTLNLFFVITSCDKNQPNRAKFNKHYNGNKLDFLSLNSKNFKLREARPSSNFRVVVGFTLALAPSYK